MARRGRKQRSNPTPQQTGGKRLAFPGAARQGTPMPGAGIPTNPGQLQVPERDPLELVKAFKVPIQGQGKTSIITVAAQDDRDTERLEKALRLAHVEGEPEVETATVPFREVQMVMGHRQIILMRASNEILSRLWPDWGKPFSIEALVTVLQLAGLARTGQSLLAAYQAAMQEQINPEPSEKRKDQTIEELRKLLKNFVPAAELFEIHGKVSRKVREVVAEYQEQQREAAESDSEETPTIRLMPDKDETVQEDGEPVLETQDPEPDSGVEPDESQSDEETDSARPPESPSEPT